MFWIGLLCGIALGALIIWIIIIICDMTFINELNPD